MYCFFTLPGVYCRKSKLQRNRQESIFLKWVDQSYKEIMALIIDDKDLKAAQLSEDELRLEIAILLYEKGRFTMGQASKFAGMNRIFFQKELGKRKISVNYDVEELEKDLKTLGIKNK